MHGGEHCDNVGTLKTTTVSRDQVEEIPRGDAGVEGVRVLETPDSSAFDYLEDEGSASNLTGSDEQLGGKPGGRFKLHFFTESIIGIVLSAGFVQFVVFQSCS